ncbi:MULTISPECIES: hypothetical protein [Rhizobium]|uniref:hypothetical protein n=1 Tax=Rhizobium TaxID=379 RepID=UPI0007E9620C|nr:MULTISPECIES: hypothetical protein [Rhizobium]ANK92202.1 hypothetical protein AMK01_CH02759 [Rhizobium sp. N6212]ANK98242.1 hypothetical protein AMK00_CH02762 [Rhizobium sp. N621]ANL04322.1 hypothetical protein AMJ99_CH02790 [Rhizobium esperanzae]ANL10434.1 hypothetical protein AMJ98_CH02790 [Rhizobium sp. N1341]ANL22487.1 hypothetical protein AMJ96_CH02793 [Rhizobium sp. N113]
MASYSIDDAIRELTPVLGKAAPAGAVSGEWIATTMQAGHSSRTGGYRDAGGNLVSEESTKPLDIIEDVIEKLDAAASHRFNKVVIRWKKAKLPFMRGELTIDTTYDQSIVPRGPEDPVYEAATAARRAFWQTRGGVREGFAAERETANVHNQTKWFGPHRRVLAVDAPEKLILATDGLSTPWAGISEPENGVECELFMEFDPATLDSTGMANWANLLINLGDLVADGHHVARDVEKHGAILFCRLTEDYAPLTRIILSCDPSRIDGLPFGSVPLIRATPVAEAEIEGRDPDEDWGATAARQALAKRGIRL